MAATLKSRQRQWLAMLAERAFNRQAALARGRGEPVDVSASARERWRHEQVAIACGKAGLRCCDQNDYGAVKARFLHLLGEDGAALAADMHGRGNERRMVESKIVGACTQLGRPLTYAEGVCRRMNRGKCLAEIDEIKALWNVFFALRYQLKKEAA